MNEELRKAQERNRVLKAERKARERKIKNWLAHLHDVVEGPYPQFANVIFILSESDLDNWQIVALEDEIKQQGDI